MACILVLEDDEISARLVSRMLKINEHEVRVAPRSEEAWIQLQEAPIDLLLLDTQLDGEHGWEFLERIRKDVLLKQLPVIVYSSVTQREVIKRYLTLGVQGILVKPTAAERLNTEVDRLTRVSWRNSLFEAEDAVEARIGLAPGEVSRLYRQAASDLRAALPELSVLVGNPADETTISRVGALKSCAINIGFTRLVELLRAITDAAADGKSEEVEHLLGRLTVALRLLLMQSGGDLSKHEHEELHETDAELPMASAANAGEAVAEMPAAEEPVEEKSTAA
jgi:DNA-binding response OmpR family regulator